MCGILGYFGNQESSFLNKVSLEKISHRGPDYSEFITEKRLEVLLESKLVLSNGFLNVLKSIQSPVSSYLISLGSKDVNQPMYSSDKNFAIIFNG